MIESDKTTVFLPEDFLDKLVFCGIPGRKIVEQQSAGVTGVRVQAPEGVVQVIRLDQAAHQRHP